MAINWHEGVAAKPRYCDITFVTRKARMHITLVKGEPCTPIVFDSGKAHPPAVFDTGQACV